MGELIGNEIKEINQSVKLNKPFVLGMSKYEPHTQGFRTYRSTLRQAQGELITA